MFSKIYIKIYIKRQFKDLETLTTTLFKDVQEWMFA